MKMPNTKVAMMIAAMVGLLGVATGNAGWAVPRFDIGDSWRAAHGNEVAESVTVAKSPTICPQCRTAKRTTVSKQNSKFAGARDMCAICGKKVKLAKN